MKLSALRMSLIQASRSGPVAPDSRCRARRSDFGESGRAEVAGVRYHVSTATPFLVTTNRFAGPDSVKDLGVVVPQLSLGNDRHHDRTVALA